MNARDKYSPRPVAAAPAWNGRNRCSGWATPPPLSANSMRTWLPSFFAVIEKTRSPFLERARTLLVMRFRNTCMRLGRSAHTSGKPGSMVHCASIFSSCKGGNHYFQFIEQSSKIDFGSLIAGLSEIDACDTFERDDEIAKSFEILVSGKQSTVCEILINGGNGCGHIANLVGNGANCNPRPSKQLMQTGYLLCSEFLRSVQHHSGEARSGIGAIGRETDVSEETFSVITLAAGLHDCAKKLLGDVFPQDIRQGG